jgi:hypothetical protein
MVKRPLQRQANNVRGELTDAHAGRRHIYEYGEMR